MIKRGKEFYFCDSCGTRFVQDQLPKFCLDCMNGSDLDEATTTTILDMITRRAAEYERHRQSNDWKKIKTLQIRLAQLFMERVWTWQVNIHGMPDGETKNARCKKVLEELDKLAGRILPGLSLLTEEP